MTVSLTLRRAETTVRRKVARAPAISPYRGFMTYKNWISLGGIAAVAFMLGFGSSILGARENRFDLKVRQDFFAGVAGDKEALARAMKAAEQALAEDPKHAEAMVWHGSGLYTMSRDVCASGNEQAKCGELFNQGTLEMDTAVALEPDSIGVRIPRGATYLTVSRFLPPNMGKPMLAKGLADYEHVYKLQAGQFDQLGVHPRGELLFGLGEGFARSGDVEKAQVYFERILSDLKGSPYAKRAARWMETKAPFSMQESGCIGCHVK